MEAFDPLIAGAAVLFEEENCRGISGAFITSGQVGEVVEYDTDAMETLGMPRNIASSLSLPYGVQVQIWDDSNFSGDTVVYSGEFYNDVSLKNTCYNIKTLTPDFDDKNMSLKVA